MENNIHKEEWINKIMNSTQGMAHAHPPAGLFEKITTNLNNRGRVKAITLPVKQWAAAAIILLAVNIGSVIYYTRQNTKKAVNITNPIATEMQQESTYNY